MARFCALLSGGKDSNYALYNALRKGWTLECIVVVHPRRLDSWMFHSIATRAALLQAEAMGYIDRTYSFEVSGVKDVEVEELEEALRSLKEELEFDTIVAGAVASRYQRSRLEAIASKLNVKLYTPSWGLDQENYMRRIVRDGFKFIIVSITTMGLPPSLLGRPIGEAEVEEIIKLSRKHGFNPAFEGGEAETLVYDAPHYSRSLCIRGRRVKVREFEYIVEVEDARLGAKGEYCLEIT
ncbi:MAG: diphthine--ammonia ligase [Thermoprotei archaeon]|nr:diphthine--ammonia ligase [Thermoprotei archaeon]